MNICVYGAASDKIDSKYIDAVEVLGREIGKRGHGLVFGAGGNGLMGAAARGVREYGGHITGVIPTFFKEESLEPIYDHCDEIIYTESMHERKRTMIDKADAFIAVPGGIGTYEEFFETIVLKQLGRHRKPVALYNVDGYFDCLEAMMHQAMQQKFIRANCDLLFMGFTDMAEMFGYLENDS